MKWKFLIYVDYDNAKERIPAEHRIKENSKDLFVGTNSESLALLLARYTSYRVVAVEAGAELTSQSPASSWAIKEVSFQA